MTGRAKSEAQVVGKPSSTLQGKFSSVAHCYVARLADRFYTVYQPLPLSVPGPACLRPPVPTPSTQVPASGPREVLSSGRPNRLSGQGFTLVEMTLVLVLSGLLLAMGIRGYGTLDSAKGDQLVLQVRQLETMTRTYARSTQRWPGDCNGNGLIDAPLADLSAADSGLAGKDRAVRAALFDYASHVAVPASVASGATSLTALPGNACPAQLTSLSIQLDTGKADFNVPWNDLKVAGLTSMATPNRAAATHAGGDFMTLAQVGLGASPYSDTLFNAIVVLNVPVKFARKLAVAVDGFDGDTAYKGRVRRLNSSGNGFASSWAAAGEAPDSTINIAYFFDQLPLAQTY